MFCPRCGAETDAGGRYCASCGAELPRAGEGGEKEKRSFRDRLGDLAGRNRRERIVSAGTVLAIAIAIAAFFALDTDTDTDDTRPAGLSASDAEAVDAACIVTKQTISEAAGRAVAPGEADLQAYSAAVLRAITEFRSQVNSLSAPALEPLSAALLDAAAEAGELSRLAREQPERAAGQARKLEEATGEVEAEIEALGLTGCSRQPTAPVVPD